MDLKIYKKLVKSIGQKFIIKKNDNTRSYFKVWFAFILCSSYLMGYGQNMERPILSGYVKDVFGKPVEGATILIVGSKEGSSTQADGYYKITGIKAERITLEISAIGYIKLQQTILMMDSKKDVFKDFEITEDHKQLQEVSIRSRSDNQQKIQDIKQSGFSVNVIDMNAYSNMTADINQVLRRTAGVTIRENGGVGSDFSFKINGLDAKIFIDGVPMDNFGNSMTLNNIPINLIDRVEIYKGVVPSYLTTDALGGAANIITKRKNRKFIDLSYGYGSLNTHQFSGIVNVTNPKTGFTVKANAFFNHSDNDYNMYSSEKYDISLKKAVDVKNSQGKSTWQFQEIDKAKRFHDQYTSAMGKIETGLENKKWADMFLFGLIYSENKRENQLGATVNTVYGGKWSTNSFITPSFHFRKDNLFIPNLYVDLYTSYSKSITHIRDTATFLYDWTGFQVPLLDKKDEEHDKLSNQSLLTRADFTYGLNQQRSQSLNLNYSYTTNRQKSYDLMESDENLRDKTGLPKSVGKHLLNLSWQGQWLDKKLITITAIKYYGLATNTTIDERKFRTDGSIASGSVNIYKKMFNYPSANLALRYIIFDDMGVKSSLERAYRLPDVVSLFGDGQNYLPNFELKPERSDNVNVGIFYNTFIENVHFLNFDLTGFLRKASNYIQPQVVGDKFKYQNLPGAKLFGFEAEVKYGYKDLITATLNGSYDKAIESTKYTDDTHSQQLLVYNQQLPNRPWIYGNADLSFGKKDLVGKGTRIELTYMYQYTHWFYLTWENLGDKGTKNYVPSQFVHSAVGSFSWKNNRYSLALEARNLTNELTYDNFRLQKPGRTFYTKFRMSIM